MQLILTGCEYAGKRTLGRRIWKWWSEQTGVEFLPLPHTFFHDHFTVPNVVHPVGHESHKELSEKEILTLNPGLLEHFQRFQIEYHLGGGFAKDPDHSMIDAYYAEAVFAPLYYGYGRPGEYGDRRMMARHYDEVVMEHAPDTILVLVKASPEVIRRRMRDLEHPPSLFKEEDTELVLGRFQEEFDNSLIRQRFAIDTTTATADESLEEFAQKVDHYLTPEDRQRISDHQGQKAT